MSTGMNRFAISIPQDMQIELDKVKKEIYNNNSQSEMIKDLIMRGLSNAKVTK